MKSQKEKNSKEIKKKLRFVTAYILSIFIVVSSFLPALGLAEAAYGSVDCQLTGSIVQSENQIQLTISLQNTGDYLDGLQFNVGYDRNAFTLSAVEDKGLIGTNSQFSATKEINPYFCSWYVGSGPQPAETQGDLVTLIFSVKAGAEKKVYSFTVREATGYRNIVQTVGGKQQVVESKVRLNGIDVNYELEGSNSIIEYTDGVTGGAIYFDTNTGTIVDCDEEVTNVVLPKEIAGVAVQSIGQEAFMWCNLSSIEIPNSVTSIGECAFWECIDLARVKIPDSVTEISAGAFGDCWNLDNVKLPANTTKIEEQAFTGCRNLTSITIPGKVAYIGEDAFRGCHGLKKVTIQQGVDTIGDGAFAGCRSLDSVTIPNSVTNIEANAFWGCGSLTDITISENVTAIGSNAFGQCDNLTISGKKGSFVENYAHENAISFKEGLMGKPGDVNGDGKVNVTDINIIRLNILGRRELTPLQREVADVNHDGKINVTDINLIRLNILGRRELV
ncbi:MAG: leucine-rich repeat protein [Firmicutes bacterium]|nr:leucine-rich repeat protein [Bacillota bacterium]